MLKNLLLACGIATTTGIQQPTIKQQNTPEIVYLFTHSPISYKETKQIEINDITYNVDIYNQTPLMLSVFKATYYAFRINTTNQYGKKVQTLYEYVQLERTTTPAPDDSLTIEFSINLRDADYGSASLNNDYKSYKGQPIAKLNNNDTENINNVITWFEDTATLIEDYTATYYTDTGTEDQYVAVSETRETGDIEIQEAYNYETYIVGAKATTTYQNSNPIEYFTDPGSVIYGINIYQQKTEVIDLPGLLFQILGMPFAFISQAFNLTLFPGTPYSINVSNLLFSVLAGVLILIIVRKLIS